MSFRKLLLAGAALAVSTATVVAPAQASIIDRPHFKVLGVVIVWGADDSDGSTPIATDFVIDDVNDTDLIAADGRTVLTGTLNATAGSYGGFSALSIGTTEIGDGDGDLDDLDSFGAFDVTTASITGDAMSHDSNFFVASNTAFGITAELTDSTVSGDFLLSDVSYSFGMTPNGTNGTLTFGGNAFDDLAPSITNPHTTLDDMDAAGATTVYQSTVRTAETTGNIVGQSVRFDASYSLGPAAGYDLSQGAGVVEATVTYTAFVP
ncbi:MAG: hypothetical protein QNI84_15300 [Henriciella sp.]|nr:hypothetical protein [Henriciella sp.]